MKRGGIEVFNTHVAVSERLVRQAHILESVRDRLDRSVADMRGVLQAEVFDDELAAAGELRRKGHLRAAGALAGVVLERHLGQVARDHGISIRKKSPTIADLNEPLKAAEVYDQVQWRRIQHLADLRNLCVHNKERDPSPEEVDRLISSTAEIIKMVA